ncbi:MAG: lipopolysaccharide biosynthesis protein [Candidatus Limimorpha sp.]
MIKKIFGTFGTRLLNALCGFITLWFGTHYLGDEAWGICATVLLDVTLLLIGVELLAGSGLIFFTPRKSFVTLFKISYIWTVIIVLFYALVIAALSYFPKILNTFIPSGFEVIVLVLVFVYSLHNFNLNILLGKERVGTQNILFIIQFMTQLFSMLFYIFVLDIRDAWAFVLSLLTGYSVAYICGLTQTLRYLNDNGRESIRESVKEMFRFGSVIQLSTLVSTLNKRLSILIIKHFSGNAQVGVFHSSTQVSESPKLIGHSIALVQFSKISNLTDKHEAARITIRLLKVAVLLTAACSIFLCIIPREIYSFVFTENFADMRVVIISLAPSIIFMTANTIFCHFFSGVDMPQHNLYGAVVGLLVTIPSLCLLIPPFGMVGAGISASLTNLATIVYQWIIFKKVTDTPIKALAISKEDIVAFKEILQSLKDIFSKKK